MNAPACRHMKNRYWRYHSGRAQQQARPSAHCNLTQPEHIRMVVRLNISVTVLTSVSRQSPRMSSSLSSSSSLPTTALCRIYAGCGGKVLACHSPRYHGFASSVNPSSPVSTPFGSFSTEFGELWLYWQRPKGVQSLGSMRLCL